MDELRLFVGFRRVLFGGGVWFGIVGSRGYGFLYVKFLGCFIRGVSFFLYLCFFSLIFVFSLIDWVTSRSVRARVVRVRFFKFYFKRDFEV